MEFEKENDIMDQRQEMMDDAIDDVTGLEDEAEGEEVVEQVLEEIGIDLKNAVSCQSLCGFSEKLMILLEDGRNSSGSPEPGCCRGQGCPGYWWGWKRW